MSLNVLQVHLDDLKPLWEALEALKNEDKVLSLGVADLSKDQLEELFNWAQVRTWRNTLITVYRNTNTTVIVSSPTFTCVRELSCAL